MNILVVLHRQLSTADANVEIDLFLAQRVLFQGLELYLDAPRVRDHHARCVDASDLGHTGHGGLAGVGARPHHVHLKLAGGGDRHIGLARLPLHCQVHR